MTTRTLTYRGPAPVVSALAQMLHEEGVEATYEPPVEGRTSGVELVVIYLMLRAGDKVTDRALDRMIDAAVERFRARFGGTGATVEGDD